MTKETKQDVFDEVLDAFDEAVSEQPGALHPTNQVICYADRYAAASDGDTDCPYCHGLRNLMDTSNGVISIDGSTLDEQQMWDYYNDEPSDTVRSVPIKYCPICGRRLGEKK